MTLTKNEMEAKLFALEDRIALLSQVVDTLEEQMEHSMARWTDWALILKSRLPVIHQQIDQIQKKVPLPPPRRTPFPRASKATGNPPP